MGANAARRQIHQLLQRRFEFSVVSRAGGVDIERQRLGDTDRVSDLDRAPFRKPGSYDVLRQITRGISPERSTLVGSLPENAPPPCGAAPP